GVLERLLRQAGELVATHLLARGVVALAADADLAARRFALAGEHLDQLALAVAGDAGDPDDFPRLDGERNLVQRRLPGVVERTEAIDHQPRRAELPDARRRARFRASVISAFTRVFRRAMRAHCRVVALAARSARQRDPRRRLGQLLRADHHARHRV